MLPKNAPKFVNVFNYTSFDQDRLPVKYGDWSVTKEQHCRLWIETPSYLVDIPYGDDNQFHYFQLGLLATFQTMRELGILRLDETDSSRNIRQRKVNQSDCAQILDDFGFNEKSKRRFPCNEDHSEEEVIQRCKGEESDTSAYCQPGALWAAPKGFIAIMNSETFMQKKWGILFDAMSDRILNLDDAKDVCFQQLIVGMSDSLNFWTDETDTEYSKQSLALFNRFVSTTIKDQSLLQKYGLEATKSSFAGYKDPRWEKLRRGVGPEDIENVDVFREELARAADVLITADDKNDMLRLVNDRSYVQNILSKFKYRHNTHNHRRPVVTFFNRIADDYQDTFRRTLLNPHDILVYVLGRYDVTLRVTHLHESFLEAVDIVRDTDVFIGVHGAAFTNTLFAKDGAVGLEILGYQMALVGDLLSKVMTAKRCTMYPHFIKNASHVFLHPLEFERSLPESVYQLHPDKKWPKPENHWEGLGAVYHNQAMYVDMMDWEPIIDKVMAAAGIRPVA